MGISSKSNLFFFFLANWIFDLVPFYGCGRVTTTTHSSSRHDLLFFNKAVRHFTPPSYIRCVSKKLATGFYRTGQSCAGARNCHLFERWNRVDTWKGSAGRIDWCRHSRNSSLLFFLSAYSTFYVRMSLWWWQTLLIRRWPADKESVDLACFLYPCVNKTAGSRERVEPLESSHWPGHHPSADRQITNAPSRPV